MKELHIKKDPKDDYEREMDELVKDYYSEAKKLRRMYETDKIKFGNTKELFDDYNKKISRLKEIYESEKNKVQIKYNRLDQPSKKDNKNLDGYSKDLLKVNKKVNSLIKELVPNTKKDNDLLNKLGALLVQPMRIFGDEIYDESLNAINNIADELKKIKIKR